MGHPLLLVLPRAMVKLIPRCVRNDKNSTFGAMDGGEEVDQLLTIQLSVGANT